MDKGNKSRVRDVSMRNDYMENYDITLNSDFWWGPVPLSDLKMAVRQIVFLFRHKNWFLNFDEITEVVFINYYSISLFLRLLGWWVCVCLYSCVHTHKLLGYLMWAQVWDGHLESQKNPDWLKRSIHVDRIGVHVTYVYIYAVLRVLMIWPNCFFF